MDKNKDTYFTIEHPVEEILFKEKNSKFIGFVYPVSSEEEIKATLEILKKRHPDSGHHCYAYILGTEITRYRVNDDGEPNNSAGMPIYGQLLSKKLTNVLLIVIRYFGGVKLGVGGLISAYKTTAQLVLDEALIIEKTIEVHYVILFQYKNLNKIMRIIKENQLSIVSQNFELDCEIIISVRKNLSEKVHAIFQNTFEVQIKNIAL
jgi:uncharacterized YigZ family protein